MTARDVRRDNPSFLDYNPDLIEPPDGGYSFIEWEDLSAHERTNIAMTRFARATNRASINMAAFGLSVTGMHKAMAEMPSLIKAMNKLAEAFQTAQAAPPRTDYIQAMPQEVEEIHRLINVGHTGHEMSMAEPVPMYTGVWVDGSVATPRRPGNMINAITFTEPVEHRESRTGGERVWWTVRVFMKA